LRKTTSFDVPIVQIGAGVLAVGWQNQKAISESIDAHFSHFCGRAKRGNRIV